MNPAARTTQRSGRATALLIVLCVMLLSACSSAVRFQPETPGFHTVRRGDTLYSIAFRNELNWRDLAQWNGIGSPYTIALGQQLRLTPGSGSSSAGSTSPTTAAGTRSTSRPVRPVLTSPPSKLNWAWPAEGKVAANFNAASPIGKGIDIAGSYGADVRAAAEGRVVYVGSGLVGYGKVIIVKHDDRYLSAYAHNDDFLVREGETVKRGQRIATMGLGSGQRPLLHFEIRLDGRAVDPQPLLPKR